MSKPVVQSSPHVTSYRTTKNVMLDVVIALVPCLIAGVCFFGARALLTVALCVLSAVGSEAVYNLCRKKKQTIGDLSAVVTGLILGLNLPSHVPVYLPIVGGVFAIVLVKMLFGGIGKNFANPAATARVFLLLAYTGAMTSFIAPHDAMKGFFTGFMSDTASGATYLSGGSQTLGQLFFGSTAGSIGETSALCILLGAAYLIIRGVIDWRIPLSVVLSVACFTTIFSGSVNGLLHELCAGGLLFSAVFMATDYATSPKTGTGRIIYGFSMGLFATMIRRFGSYPEGMSFAIILANLLVPFIDRWVLPVRFGQKKVDVTKIVTLVLAAMMAVCIAIYTPVTVRVKSKFTASYDYGAVQSVEKKLNGTYYVESQGKLDGHMYPPDTYWADPSFDHYFGSVWLSVCIKDGTIKQIVYLADTMHGDKVTVNESIKEENFAPYLGKKVSEIAEFNYESDIVAGATYTSKAIHDAVRAAATGYLQMTGGAQ